MLIDQEHTGIMRTKTHPRQLGIPLSRWGRNLIACCPFHSPEETSLFFYDALGYWRYRCLQCGSEGDLIEFVMRSRFNGMEEPQARAEALEFLGALEPDTSDPLQDEHPWIKEIGGEKSKVLESFVRYCHWAACKSPSSAEFLSSRGWSIGQAQLYGLGYYSGDPEPFVSYCMLSGIERHQISFYLDNLEAYHEPSITIPARNSKGLIHSVYGRLLDDDNHVHPYISYASGPSDIPFNIQPENDKPIIVEGFFDALTADLAGIPGVVSTMYQELTQSHLFKLKACGAESVTVILRREANRREQEFRIQRYLKMAEELNLKFKSIVLPKDETIDQVVRKNGADQLLSLIDQTEEDTVHTHRRSMLLQDIKENFDTAMACPPDVSVGYAMNSFPKLTKEIDGIQSGCFYVSSNPFGLKTTLLSSFALDLLQSNPKLKLIYLALETPRRQIFDRMVAGSHARADGLRAQQPPGNLGRPAGVRQRRDAEHPQGRAEGAPRPGGNHRRHRPPEDFGQARPGGHPRKAFLRDARPLQGPGHPAVPGRRAHRFRKRARGAARLPARFRRHLLARIQGRQPVPHGQLQASGFKQAIPRNAFHRS